MFGQQGAEGASNWTAGVLNRARASLKFLLGKLREYVHHFGVTKMTKLLYKQEKSKLLRSI